MIPMVCLDCGEHWDQESGTQYTAQCPHCESSNVMDARPTEDKQIIDDKVWERNREVIE